MPGVLAPGGFLWQLARGNIFGPRRRRRRWSSGRLVAENPSQATLANLLEFAGLPPDLARTWAVVLRDADGHRGQTVRCGHGVSVRMRRRKRRWQCTIQWRRTVGRPPPPPIPPGVRAA
jgi:hypothetical protein